MKKIIFVTLMLMTLIGCDTYYSDGYYSGGYYSSGYQPSHSTVVIHDTSPRTTYINTSRPRNTFIYNSSRPTTTIKKSYSTGTTVIGQRKSWGSSSSKWNIVAVATAIFLAAMWLYFLSQGITAPQLVGRRI